MEQEIIKLVEKVKAFLEKTPDYSYKLGTCPEWEQGFWGNNAMEKRAVFPAVQVLMKLGYAVQQSYSFGVTEFRITNPIDTDAIAKKLMEAK